MIAADSLRRVELGISVDHLAWLLVFSWLTIDLLAWLLVFSWLTIDLLAWLLVLSWLTIDLLAWLLVRTWLNIDLLAWLLVTTWLYVSLLGRLCVRDLVRCVDDLRGWLVDYIDMSGSMVVEWLVHHSFTVMTRLVVLLHD